MGSNEASRTYTRLTDRAAIEKRFREDQAQCRAENGSSYSGEIGCLSPGIGRWIDARAENEDAAAEILFEKHDKGGTALAVSFKIPRAPTPEEDAEEKRLGFAARDLSDVLERFRASALTALRGASTARVTCRGCGSAVARKHLQSLKCPVCPAMLSSEAVLRKLSALEAEVSGAQARYRAASTPKPGEAGIGWVVGGNSPC